MRRAIARSSASPMSSAGKPAATTSSGAWAARSSSPCSGSSDLDEGRSYAERVRAAFVGGSRAGGPTPTISAGVTAALAPPDLERLLRDADDALYAAKCTGRNRTVSQPAEANILRPGPMAAELTRLG